MKQAKRPFAIVAGGGPVGMILALELGHRGIACVLVNERPGPTDWPKANATSPRSMEHLRRLGIAGRFRSLAIPHDYPTDVSYYTRMNGYPLARLRMPGWGAAVAETARGEGPWPGPEPAHRGSQLFLEQAMFERLAAFPSIERRFGWRCTGFEETAGGVRARIVEVTSGREDWIEADYLVGCDGGGSVVRKQLGIEFEGDAGIVRAFMGGSMVSCFIRLAPPTGAKWPEPAWQYWIVNAEARGLCIPVDGKDRFVFAFQLPEKRALDAAYVRERIDRACGVPALREVISFTPWTAGYRLLAQRYGAGRVYLAGDAVHLFTPTGGMGMNTGIDDAVNLAWKLAAIAQGWGGPKLLASYETDRRPIGARNLGWSKHFADWVGTVPATPAIETDTEEGAREREIVGKRLAAHAAHEFLIPGIHLGMRYENSPIVWHDGTPSEPDPANEYRQTGRPGHRAPHVWIEPGVALYDRLGREFTLLRMGGAEAAARDIAAAFAARRIPLAVLSLPRPDARDLYGADLALIGPDQFVYWRGETAPADAIALADRVRGA